MDAHCTVQLRKACLYHAKGQLDLQISNSKPLDMLLRAWTALGAKNAYISSRKTQKPTQYPCQILQQAQPLIAPEEEPPSLLSLTYKAEQKPSTRKP